MTKVVVIQYICGYIATMNLEIKCFHSKKFEKKNQLRVPYVCVLLFSFFLVKKSRLLFINPHQSTDVTSIAKCLCSVMLNAECCWRRNVFKS